MSGRYTELPGHWYIPELDNVRVRVGKPGHYTYEKADERMAYEFIMRLDYACTSMYELYKQFLEDGLAPEQARFFLHVNHYTEMYWTVNARSLMNFLNLRTHETAQWEIRQYANFILNYFEQEMPLTFDAFINNNKIAP